jgi:hypothetical protein
MQRYDIRLQRGIPASAVPDADASLLFSPRKELVGRGEPARGIRDKPKDNHEEHEGH